MVELRWREPDRTELMELYQVLHLRDGKVFDMQDFNARGAAVSALGHVSRG